MPFFAGEKVRFVGEIIAAVVAPNRYIAEDIVDLIEVEYEPLPVNFDIEEAMKPKRGDDLVHEEVLGNVYFDDSFEKGDIRRAFQESDLIVKERVCTARTTAAPMETRGVVADWGLDDTLTVWSSTQMPYPFAYPYRTGVEFSRTEHPRRCAAGGRRIRPEMSFLFRRIHPAMDREDLRRPVKWIEDRREHLLSATQAKQMTMDIEVAMKNDGTILGIKCKTSRRYRRVLAVSPWRHRRPGHGQYGPARRVHPQRTSSIGASPS